MARWITILILNILLCMWHTAHAQDIADSFGSPLENAWETYTTGSHRDFALQFTYNHQSLYHTGVDTNINTTPTGTPVYAIANGIVRYAGAAGGYGNYNGTGYVVIIEHTLTDGGHILSLYGHVQNGTYNETGKTGLITTDTIVTKGQYIAAIADYMQGSENWHHLHLGILPGSYAEVGISTAVRGYEDTQEDVTASWWNPSDLLREENLMIFEDTPPGSWYLEKLADLYTLGIIAGYEDAPGTFGPDNTVTRAEFCKMVVEGANERTSGTFSMDGSYGTSFSDVSTADWFYDYVMVLAEADVLDGYGDGTFGPNDEITRSQAAKIVANAFSLNDETCSDSPWSDFTSGDDLFEETLSLYAYQVMAGYIDETFQPDNTINRAEAAVTIGRAIDADNVREECR